MQKVKDIKNIFFVCVVYLSVIHISLNEICLLGFFGSEGTFNVFFFFFVLFVNKDPHEKDISTS